MSLGVAIGDVVQPRESRREVRRLCAKWWRVCWLLLSIWWAASTRRTSRISRTDGRPAPTPSCDMKSSGEDEERASLRRFLKTAAISLSMSSSSVSVMGTTNSR